MKILLLCALVIVAGCATGSHVLTGNARPAVAADAVKVYAVMPERAEVIGLVNASNDALYKQAGMDSVIKKLKKEAAAIGANGVVVSGQLNNAWTGTEVSGTAIFVP